MTETHAMVAVFLIAVLAAATALIVGTSAVADATWVRFFSMTSPRAPYGSWRWRLMIRQGIEPAALREARTRRRQPPVEVFPDREPRPDAEWPAGEPAPLARPYVHCGE